MIRPTVKYGLEALGVGLAGLALLMGLLAWRLAAGPISMDFVTATIVDLANAELEQGALSVDETVLSWDPEDQKLIFSLNGAILKDDAGAEVLTVPEIRVTFSAAAMLQGSLGVRDVELVGVRARVIRRPDTGIELALVSSDDEGGTLDDALAMESDKKNIGLIPLLEQLSDPDDTSTLAGGLRSFGMRDAEFEFIDEVNDVAWVAPSATLTLTRDGGGVSLLMDAGLQLGEARLDIELFGRATAGADRIQFDARGEGLVPAALARTSPMFSDFAVLDAPVRGEGTVTIGLDGALLGAKLNLSAGAGQAVFPLAEPQTVQLDSLDANLELDPVGNKLLLHGLTFEAGENRGTISGEAVYDQPDGFHVSGATVALNADDLSLQIDGFTDGVARIDNMTFAGRLDFDAIATEISALTLRVGDGTLALSGHIEDAPGSPAIHAHGEAANIQVDRLGDIWPLPLATGARDWFTENVSGGTLTRAKIDLAFGPGMIADADLRSAKLPDDAMDIQFNITGARVNYIDGMPPLQRVSGRGHLQGDRFDTWIDGAYVDVGGDRLQLARGHFEASALHVKGGPGKIEFTTTGATATILALLDHEPLGFISDYGTDPASVGGYGEVEATIALPLTKTVEMEDLDIRARAVARDVFVPGIFNDVSLDGGSLVVDVTQDGLDAKGDVTLNGVAQHVRWKEDFSPGGGPSSEFELTGVSDDAGRRALGLDVSSIVNGDVYSEVTVIGSGDRLRNGTVRVNLTDAVLKQEVIGWSKPAGSPAEGRFDLVFEPRDRTRLNAIAIRGAEIDLSGMVLLGPDGDLEEAVLPDVRLGQETRASFTAKRETTGILTMHAEGPSFDARGVLTNLFSGKAAPTSGTVDEGDRTTLQDVEGEEPTNLALTARFPDTLAHGGIRTRNVDVDLLILNGETQRLIVTGDLNREADVTATIRPTPDGQRIVSATSSDAGKVLRAIDFYESIRGGDLDVTGTFDDFAAGSPLQGHVTIRDFRVVNAPLLANLLTIGSLTGINDTLQGEGIAFVRLDLPYRMTTERFHVDEARISGPAIGITVKGQIDRVEGAFDLNGTIVPAYTINSILGNVPILGDLIVGREGEGIFAATYAMRGTREQPTITVNPLAALAPGFLRRIFEFGEILPPEEEVAAPEPGTLPAAPAPAPPADTP